VRPDWKSLRLANDVMVLSQNFLICRSNKEEEVHESTDGCVCNSGGSITIENNLELLSVSIECVETEVGEVWKLSHNEWMLTHVLLSGC